MAIGNSPFDMIFNLENGLSPERESSKRYLSDVKNIFYDTAEAGKIPICRPDLPHALCSVERLDPSVANRVPDSLLGVFTRTGLRSAPDPTAIARVWAKRPLLAYQWPPSCRLRGPWGG